MSSEFDCALCQELLQIPVMQVDTFGNLCPSCFQKISKVSRWDSVRNKQLEERLQEITTPCKYQWAGCREEILFKNLQNHQSKCKFRTTNCLYCPWVGPPKKFPQHFEKNHAGEVLGATDEDKFIFELDLRYFTDLADVPPILKLLKTGLKGIFFKIDGNSESLCYTILGSNNDHSTYSIKHSGISDSLETECKTTSGGINDNNWSADVQVASLVKIAGDSQTITIEVLENTAGFVKRTLECLDCPICSEMMKPPIYLCSNGHSYCSVCKPQLKECAICRGDVTNARNYTLETLAEEFCCDSMEDKANDEIEDNEVLWRSETNVGGTNSTGHWSWSWICRCCCCHVPSVGTL